MYIYITFTVKANGNFQCFQYQLVLIYFLQVTSSFACVSLCALRRRLHGLPTAIYWNNLRLRCAVTRDSTTRDSKGCALRIK
jgi:hypothetical protein